MEIRALTRPFLNTLHSAVLRGTAFVFLLSVGSLRAQQAGVDLLGSPIPGLTAMGHHAIGVIPALLATNRPFSRRDGKLSIPDSLNRRARRALRRQDRLRFFSGFEGAIAAETPLLDGTSLVDWAQGKTEWTLEERRAVADQLAMSPTDAAASLRWVGWSRHGRRGGWGWTVEDRYVASVNPSANLSEFVMLGPASSLYDQVVLTDGTLVGVDTLTNEQFGMVETGLRAEGSLLALELLDGSSLAVQHVRSYGAGFGVKLLDTKALSLSAERLSGICGGRGITRSIRRNSGPLRRSTVALVPSWWRPTPRWAVHCVQPDLDSPSIWPPVWMWPGCSLPLWPSRTSEAWIGRANATA